jgi:hypothetical protein
MARRAASTWLHEDRLDDGGLAARLVALLERQGFGELSDRQKAAKLGKLDSAIEASTSDLREASKRAALEEIERQFAGEAA